MEQSMLDAEIPISVAEQIKQTLQQALSGIREKRLTINDALTSTPFHPYEKLKYTYLDQQGLSAIDFSQLPALSSFDLTSATHQLTSINKQFVEDFYTRIPRLSGTEALQNANIGNMFSSLSSNGEFVVDTERMSKHVQHIEMVKGITAQQVDQNPVEVAQKLIASFINAYGR